MYSSWYTVSGSSCCGTGVLASHLGVKTGGTFPVPVNRGQTRLPSLYGFLLTPSGFTSKSQASNPVTGCVVIAPPPSCASPATCAFSLHESFRSVRARVGTQRRALPHTNPPRFRVVGTWVVIPQFIPVSSRFAMCEGGMLFVLIMCSIRTIFVVKAVELVAPAGRLLVVKVLQ